MSEKRIVGFITASGEDEAKSIATALVEERLAACVNIIPAIRSIYMWEGVIHDDAETLMIFKTSEKKFTALKDRVHELHSYDIPEIIALPIGMGAEKYLKWLDDCVE